MNELNISAQAVPEMNIEKDNPADINLGNVETRKHNKLSNLDFESSGHTGFQEKLTFDDKPTYGSTNPVTSSGIYATLLNKLGYKYGCESEIDTYIPELLGKTELYMITSENYPGMGVSNFASYFLISTIMEIETSSIFKSHRVYQWKIIADGTLYKRSALKSGTTATWSDWESAVYASELENQLSNYQEKLTFDDTPTQGSANPVKSGGLYTALDNKVDKVVGMGLTRIFAMGDHYVVHSQEGDVEVYSNEQTDSAISQTANLILPKNTVSGNEINLTDHMESKPLISCKLY